MLRTIFLGGFCAVLFLISSPSVFSQTSPPAKFPDGIKILDTVEGLTNYRLSNGLNILLIPDASQPKFTINCTILVGSRQEGYGETGMAHLLEHMQFKGCPKFPNVPKALRDHGAGYFNGTTWLDRTNYYETMPASDENLSFGIELEADRLVNSFIRREDLMSEFTVVRNEFEMGENSAETILSQRMAAVAYEWHNYGKSTIGNRTDIERVPIPSLRAFYKKYYRPDNAVLIIAGKFDPARALNLIAKYFGPIRNPASPIPVTYTEEPPQDGERFVTLRRVGTIGATGALYHIPAGSYADFPACEVLNQILTADSSGRLYKALVETKLATSVSGAAFPNHDPGVLEILAQTDPGKTLTARDTMIDVLENLTKNPVTDGEMSRAKRQLLQARERTLSDTQKFAVQLSEWAACGSWKLFFLHRDRLEKVTAEDVNRVAAKYLVRPNRTTGIYIPTKVAERAEVPATPDVAALVKNYRGRSALAAGEAFDPTPENIEKRVLRGTVGIGVKYAFLPKKTRGETVNLTLVLHFGNEQSLKGLVDASDFLGPMLLRGTKSKSRQELQDALDKLNAQVSISSKTGQVSVAIQAKRANLPPVLVLLGEVLREPAFPVTEFDLLKREELESAEKARTQPQALAVTALRRKLNPYPPDHVLYVPTIPESIERTKATTLDAVEGLYVRQLGSTAGELAVVGDFEPDATRTAIDEILRGWKNRIPYRRVEQTAVATEAAKIKIETPDKENAVYLAGVVLPISDADPAYPALVVGNYMLGAAPLASRLSTRVRVKDGLSYSVSSMLRASPFEKAGTFMVFAIANPKNVGKVDAAVTQEITRFVGEGVSASELEEAKKAYIQSEKGRRTNDRSLAGLLAGALEAGRTFEYYTEREKKIEDLQPGDVKKAFDALLDPKKLIVVEAGDFNKN
ncbi:MAG TPA: pitrilysin family protein [Fimbriiglobus sp.]